MDSTPENGRGSGQESRGGNRRTGNRNRSGGGGQNRNRSRNRDRGQNRDENRDSPSAKGRHADSTYRPRSGEPRKAEPKKGLLQKIIGFFKGPDESAGNRGTGRPIQTERKRPGGDQPPVSTPGDRRPASAANRPPRENEERPQRSRSRRSEGGESRDRDRERGPRRERGGDSTRERSSDDGDDRRPRATREPRIVEVTSGRLYVGNLIYEVSEEDLQDLFKGFGNVVSAEIVTNQRNQQSKGFAFVEMSHVDEARRAVEILHDKDFMGRKLVVTGAKSDGPIDVNSDADEGSTPGTGGEAGPASALAPQDQSGQIDPGADAEEAATESADEGAAPKTDDGPENPTTA